MNFVHCESFLESNSSDILALCETNLDDSIDSGNFSVRGYLLLICMVLQFVKEGFLFPLWITFFVFMLCFYSISSNTDEVLLINLSVKVFETSMSIIRTG